MDAAWSFCQVIFEWIAAFYGWGVGDPMHYALLGVVVGAFSAVAFYYLERPDEPTECIGSFVVGAIIWPFMLPILVLVFLVIGVWISGLSLIERVLLRTGKRT